MRQKYLLDTCIVSELIKPDPSTKVLEWVNSISEDQLFLSVITLGELKKGVLLLESGKKKSLYQDFVHALQERFEGRWIEIDINVIHHWAEQEALAKKIGAQKPLMDSLIGACASANGLVLVTRNTKDFYPSLKLLNPFLL